jgi:hypothetical protein
VRRSADSDLAPHLTDRADSDWSLIQSGASVFQNRALILQGAALFGLLTQWHTWVERRVETILFADANTVRRTVTMDFAWRLPALALLDSNLPELQLVPLTQLQKRPVTNFDLRDETGRRLPLLSKRVNGPAAAATLIAAAHAFAPPSLPGVSVENTPHLLEDLWRIGTGSPTPALAVRSELGRIRDGETGVETAMRNALANSQRFMGLAGDLAVNFLAITELELEDQQRRILTYAFDEPIGVPRVVIPPMGLIKSSRRRIEDRRETRKEDVQRAPHEGKFTATTSAGTPVPHARLMVHLSADQGGQRCASGITSQDGSLTLSLPSGEFALRHQPPHGFVSLNRFEMPFRAPGDPVELAFAKLPAQPRAPAEPTVKLGVWLRRAASLTAHQVDLVVPAVAQAASYHVEFVIPEGLTAESGRFRLISRSSPADLQRASDHRLHLHLAGIEQPSVAQATVRLRPRTSTVLRGAVWTGVLLLLLQTALLAAWPSLNAERVGPLIALVGAIPAGLGAYVARSQGDSYTYQVLVFTRGLALLESLWCVAAAAVLAMAAGAAEPTSAQHHLAHLPKSGSRVLLVLTGLNVLTCVVLCIGLWGSSQARRTNLEAGA